MEHLSIRTRLALVIILSALPALAVGLYNGVERAREARENVRQALMAAAAVAAGRVEVALAAGNTSPDAAYKKALQMPLPNGATLAVVTADGVVLARRPAGALPPGQAEP
ncbi:MAG TPA: hypothetical protein VFK15_03670, partial [Burkholderiales bacterium]|nr:hypothetical protein [Burkholderiales bacterium]